MDVAALLAAIGSACEADVDAKVLACRHAHQTLLESKSTEDSLESFFGKIHRDVFRITFGRPSEDAYFTGLFASICHREKTFDLILAAVLNHLALELTYQTRFLAAGREPDAFVFEGSRDLFTLCMAQANTVFGVCVSDRPARIFDIPEWAVGHPFLELTNMYLADSNLNDLAKVLKVNNRLKIGCLVVELPIQDGSDPVLSERYIDVANLVDNYTSYVIFGPVHLVLRAVSEYSKNCLTARIFTRVYMHDKGNYHTIEAISVISGVDNIPNIRLYSSSVKECIFRNVSESVAGGDLDILNFITPVEYRPPEIIECKAPFAVSASAPLPSEIGVFSARSFDYRYKIAILSGGMLVPTVGIHRGATYLHIAKDGTIVLDYGNEFEFSYDTPMYRHGVKNLDGFQQSKLSLGRVLRVNGAAMPLLFTPNLYQWFSHFVIQCLPRIEILKEIGYPKAKIVVPQGMRRKQLAMINMAGVALDDIVMVPEGAIVQADELIVPTAWPLAFSPFTTEIYRRMMARAGIKTAPPHRRVLISRESRKTWRNLLNFDAVRRHLHDDFEFELIKPEELSLEAEMEVFHQAQVVVGAEGAGLYGAVYAQPESAFISISDEDYAMPIMASLAKIRGFNLGYVFGESMRSDGDLARRLPFGHTDFVVDPMRVGVMVKRALELFRQGR